MLKVLGNDPDAPRDLLDKSVALAGRLLEIDPEVRGGRGEERARELVRSGAARRTLDEIIEAQGPSPCSSALGPMTYEITATRPGRVTAIDCLRIASIARLAGAPTDPGAGLLLLKDVGAHVRAGDPLYRIHGEDPSDFSFAVEAAGEASGFIVDGA